MPLLSAWYCTWSTTEWHSSARDGSALGVAHSPDFFTLLHKGGRMLVLKQLFGQDLKTKMSRFLMKDTRTEDQAH